MKIPSDNGLDVVEVKQVPLPDPKRRNRPDRSRKAIISKELRKTAAFKEKIRLSLNLPSCRLNIKQRMFGDAICEGLSPKEAYKKAGYQGIVGAHNVDQLVTNPKIADYIRWKNDRRAINADHIKEDALIRLSVILTDPETPPMVATVASRIALQHWEAVQKLPSHIEEEKILPAEYVEAVIRIRKKLVRANEFKPESIIKDVKQIESYAIRESGPESTYPENTNAPLAASGTSDVGAAILSPSRGGGSSGEVLEVSAVRRDENTHDADRRSTDEP